MSRRKPRSPTGAEVQVERLADLSRLSISPREAERLRIELSSILDYFATLDRVDVSGTPPFRSNLGERSTREDTVGASIPEEILKGVPQRKGRYIRAPRVF